MKNLWLLVACVLVVCSPGVASAQHACIQPIPQTPFEAAFLESTKTVFATARLMGITSGDEVDFCFTTGVGNTYFYRLPEQRRSGIRFSIDDFHAVYGLSPRQEDAFLANFMIFLHELGHLTAYYMNRQDALVSLATIPQAPLPIMVRARLRKGPQDFLRMEETLASRSMAGEAFADCVAGFMLQDGVQSMVSRLMSSYDPNARALGQYLHNVFLPSTMRVVMGTVARVAESVNNHDRVHGTLGERFSFVKYGMDAARFYSAPVYGSSRAGAELALCAVSAYEVQLRHVKGRETPFVAFDNGY